VTSGVRDHRACLGAADQVIAGVCRQAVTPPCPLTTSNTVFASARCADTPHAVAVRIDLERRDSMIMFLDRGRPSRGPSRKGRSTRKAIGLPGGALAGPGASLTAPEQVESPFAK